MPRFIESIKLLDGTLFNLAYHQQRVDRTVGFFFPQSKAHDLIDLLKREEMPPKGLWKCRIVYDHQIQKIEFNPYQIRPIHSLRIVIAEGIEYDYKFENRDALNELYSAKENADDVIIVKDGLVTDSSYANLIFKRSEKWITPLSYLLNGTMRQHLMESKKIISEPILLHDIRKFEKVKLINSMLGFEGPEIEVSNIIF